MQEDKTETSNLTKKIGQNIQYYRKRNKLTLRQLAERIGVTHSIVSQWENGLKEPTPTNRMLLSKALRINEMDLVLPHGDISKGIL